MAKIVLGVGTSHSPQLSVRAVDWQVLREKDEHDPRLDYQDLLKRAKPNLERELTAEKFRQRDEACQKAVKTLGDILQQVNPDVVIIFGDDQHEQFQDDNMPTFAIYHGKSLPVVTDSGAQSRGWKTAEERGWAVTAPEYQAASRRWPTISFGRWWMRSSTSRVVINFVPKSASGMRSVSYTGGSCREASCRWFR